MFSATLHQRLQLAPDIFELVFTRPRGLVFKPGQHIRFHHDGCQRDYTPVSLDQTDLFRLCVSRKERPGFSRVLCDCLPGTEFNISGPHGHFVFQTPRVSAPPVIFIGTGTGIAPFVAFARAGARCRIVLHGARTAEVLLYREVLEQSCLTYVPCISGKAAKGSAPENSVFQGRVTDYLNTRLPRGRYQFHICGQRQMILDTMDVIDEKFSDSRVFTERFS